MIAVGIDVSKYQGTIDWAAVKSTGIDFAIIRVGYRTTETGTLTEEELNELEAAGINEKVSYKALMGVLEECGEDKASVMEALEQNCDNLIPKHIVIEDILVSIEDE